MRTPAIANAEIHRLAPPEQLGILRLVPSREFGNRTSIAAERKEPPFLRIITAERNAGIVMDDGGAVGEQKVAHRGEIAGLQQIGSALDQAVAGRQCPTKFQEARAPHAAVRKIGGEIIKRPFLAVASGEQDTDAAG